MPSITSHRAGFAALVLSLAAALLPAPPAEAADVQVALDSSGKITVIDRQLESRLRLFPERADFHEARLYRLAEGGFSLEITSESGGVILRDRLPMSSTEIEAFRIRVSRAVDERAPAATVDQSGRPMLVAGIRTLAASYYGLSLPMAFDVQDGASALGIYCLTAGTGFFLPLWLTRNLVVSEGQAELGLFGGIHGIIHAAFLNIAFRNAEPHFQTFAALGITISLAELYAGYKWAGFAGTTGGQGRTMHVASAFGTALGLGTAYLVEGDGGRMGPYGWLGLAGSAAGLWAGHLMGTAQSYSTGDGTLVAVTGAMCGHVAHAAIYAAGVRDHKAWVGSAMGGAAAGLILGHRLTSDRDLGAGQATLIGLGTLSGELSGQTGNGKALLTLGATGAAAGFAVSWWLLADEIPDRSSPLPGRLSLYPAALAAKAPLPAVTVSASF